MTLPLSPATVVSSSQLAGDPRRPEFRRLGTGGTSLMPLLSSRLGTPSAFRVAAAIIPCDYQVTTAAGTVIRADEAVADAVFERRSCGTGSKGPRFSDWAMTAPGRPGPVPADPPAALPPGPAHLLPMLSAGGQAGD